MAYPMFVRVRMPMSFESPDVIDLKITMAALRVLLVAGAPTWDYRLVQTLLSRDKTIGLSCWLPTLSYETAKRAYHEWLDVMPSSRIMSERGWTDAP